MLLLTLFLAIIINEVYAKPIGNLMMFGIIMAIIVGIAFVFLAGAAIWWALNGCEMGHGSVRPEPTPDLLSRPLRNSRDVGYATQIPLAEAVVVSEPSHAINHNRQNVYIADEDRRIDEDNHSGRKTKPTIAKKNNQKNQNAQIVENRQNDDDDDNLDAYLNNFLDSHI